MTWSAPRPSLECGWFMLFLQFMQRVFFFYKRILLAGAKMLSFCTFTHTSYLVGLIASFKWLKLVRLCISMSAKLLLIHLCILFTSLADCFATASRGCHSSRTSQQFTAALTNWDEQQRACWHLVVPQLGAAKWLNLQATEPRQPRGGGQQVIYNKKKQSLWSLSSST